MRSFAPYVFGALPLLWPNFEMIFLDKPCRCIILKMTDDNFFAFWNNIRKILGEFKEIAFKKNPPKISVN